MKSKKQNFKAATGGRALLPVQITPELLAAAKAYKRTMGGNFFQFLDAIEKNLFKRGYIVRRCPAKSKVERPKRSVMITEIPIQIFSDGKIVWNGFDKFLWWLLHRKSQEGFLQYANKISSFQK